MSDFTWATMRTKVLFLASLAPSVHSIPDDRERLKAIYLPTLRRRTGMRRYDPKRTYPDGSASAEFGLDCGGKVAPPRDVDPPGL